MRHKKVVFGTILAAVWVSRMAGPAPADQVSFLFATDLRPFYYPGELVDWEVHITIEDVEGNGRDSQGLASFVFDVASNTGVVQAPTFFSPTSINVPSVRITHPVWSREEPPVFIGGFGFFGFNDLGNRTSQPGSVLGVGASISLTWGRGFRPPYPEILHNVGYGTPPGIDMGGHQVPSPEMGPRDQWYLVGGAAVAPTAPGTYQVGLGPPWDSLGANLISPTADLNFDITGAGLVIPATNIVGDSFSFDVVGLGDFDGDGDVDLADFVVFQLCFGGSNNPPAGSCPPGVNADLDGDGDVDIADFLIFQQEFTGSL